MPALKDWNTRAAADPGDREAQSAVFGTARLRGRGDVIIYDETDGLNFYNEYGMLRALFADPALAADKRYADVLRGYLRSQTIGPLPFRRLAAARPDMADALFRKVLRKPNFTSAASASSSASR